MTTKCWNHIEKCNKLYISTSKENSLLRPITRGNDLHHKINLKCTKEL